MKRIPAVVLLIACLCTDQLAAYKIKPFKPKPAKEYAAYQDFQNIVIAADPRLTEEGVQELFDTKKMLDRLIMPVVVVVENNNDFAIRILAEDVLMVDSTGAQIPGIPYDTVLLRLALRGSLGSYSTRKDILIKQVGDKNMVMDFEHKYFGEKLIAPHDSDFGVIFFPIPANAELTDTRLYVRQLQNITKDEPLMFFEFDLSKAKK